VIGDEEHTGLVDWMMARTVDQHDLIVVLIVVVIVGVDVPHARRLTLQNTQHTRE
jgi:hypothetical protein